MTSRGLLCNCSSFKGTCQNMSFMLIFLKSILLKRAINICQYSSNPKISFQTEATFTNGTMEKNRRTVSSQEESKRIFTETQILGKGKPTPSRKECSHRGFSCLTRDGAYSRESGTETWSPLTSQIQSVTGLKQF